MSFPSYSPINTRNTEFPSKSEFFVLSIAGTALYYTDTRLNIASRAISQKWSTPLYEIRDYFY